MAATALLALLLAVPWVRGQPHSPLAGVAAAETLSLPELAGRWFLRGVASRCSHLAEHSHRLEGTALELAVAEGQSLAVSTFTKLDGQCWEVRQRYVPMGTHGRFSLQGRGYGSKAEVVVAETDHRSYAILYYQDGRGLSIKLYGRSARASEVAADRFEQRARAAGLGEEVTYYFPTYGFCDSADEFHILDEMKL